MQEQKESTKDLIIALMHQSRSNQPVCETCGNHFKPDKEKIKVEIPETGEAPPHATKTDFVEKPDYCSDKCKTTAEL